MRPLLSILLPTYNHERGARKALQSLGLGSGTPDVEVIVADDSTNPTCAAAIQALTESLPNAQYIHNLPSRGAVNNWNFLLDQARGNYCLLLHHDEYLQSSQVLGKVLLRLRSTPSIEGIVLPCRVKNSTAPARLHFPAWIAESLTHRWPGYLLRRNLLGPPSTLILQRELYERYDTRLRWLVDMELYSRVMSRRKLNIVFLRGPGIISSPATESITSTLQPQLKAIEKAELVLLADSHGRASIWLGKPSASTCVLRAVEASAWYSFRILQRLFHLMRIFVSSPGKSGPDSRVD
jgi:glycosyltransferase involved in cell wall biosynthesis